MRTDKLPKKRSIPGKIYARIRKRNYFLITSSGQMATFWLASQLNKHPKIFCSHSYDRPAWGAEGSPLRGKDGERQRDIIKQYLAKMSLKEFFKENAIMTDKPIIGNVHAYNIDRALELRNKENLSQLKIANLIRHPITRINSLLNCIKNEWFDYGYIDHLSFVPKLYLEQGRKLVKDCLGNYADEIDDSFSKQFFVVSLILERGTAYAFELAEKNNIPSFKYEDITHSRETMDKLARYLCGDSIIDDYSWIKDDISYKKLNSHSNNAYSNIELIFQKWEPWQKELYMRIISEDVFKLYTKGYYDSIIL